jgi:hypothetical protein
MAGSQTFNKLQKERRRKEKQQEKAARRLERRREKPASLDGDTPPNPIASDANKESESVDR